MTKIVFFDIDGTLMVDKRIPESVPQAIALLKERGILPVLATGRSEYEIRDLRAELGIDWALTCNGAHVGYQGRTVRGKELPRERVAQWLERLQEGHSLLLYGAERFYSTNANCPYFLQARQEIGFLEPLAATAADELPSLYQAILFCPEEQEAHYIGDHAEELNLHRWRTWATDLNPHGMNKSIGISALLDHLGFAPEDAAAFGDGKNDIEMLQYVGLGIAMGNACPELLAVAAHTTRHAREDGILHGVETMILK